MKKFCFVIFLALFFIAVPKPVDAAISPRLYNGATQGFTLTYGDQKFNVDPGTLADWNGNFVLSTNNYVTRPPLNQEDFFSRILFPNSIKPEARIVHFSPKQAYQFINSIASSTNQSAIEPNLEIKDNVVVNFSPPQEGIQIDVMQTLRDSLMALENGQSTATITAATIEPRTSLSQTNTLGINTLIAHGVSNFKGSPNNRRHNIAVGVEKFKGIIVAQGEEFSFNKNLGPVEAAEGFLPELVIKREGTIPELGGGLCQVSTTTFRAAMEAGLPITARRNHAYAVQYYSPQGTDATIYPGSSDLKFINDTPGAILIWPYFKDTNTLIFDFYGTKDGRQVTLEKPIQFDRKPDGSLKASWTREVTKDGQTKTDTFKSVYQSPALYHKTESFVASAPAATGGLQMPKTN